MIRRLNHIFTFVADIRLRPKAWGVLCSDAKRYFLGVVVNFAPDAVCPMVSHIVRANDVPPRNRRAPNAQSSASALGFATDAVIERRRVSERDAIKDDFGPASPGPSLPSSHRHVCVEQGEST
jgi:hypothetical protein